MAHLRQQGFTEQTSQELNMISQTFNTLQRQMAKMKQMQMQHQHHNNNLNSPMNSQQMPSYPGGPPQQQQSQAATTNGMSHPTPQQQQMQMPVPPMQMQAIRELVQASVV